MTRYGAENMKCVMCKGTLEDKTTDYIEKQDNLVVSIENVPCEKCSQCGEEYFSTDAVRKIENILNRIQKISSSLTVTVINYKDKIA